MTTGPLAKILDWLRAGYPQGIPQSDYVALMGILHRSLTEHEVEQVALALQAGEGGIDSSIPVERIREALRREVHQEPSAEDVERVMARIDAGWSATKRSEG